jgi:predicted nucleic acid-binding protein
MIRIGLVIDTGTWIEYYETNNPEITTYIDGDEDLYVSSITLTEILRSLIPKVGEDEARECVLRYFLQKSTRSCVLRHCNSGREVQI